MEMRQLIHNGVLVPERYKPVGLHITVRGRRILLNRDQEEMAVAWAKKQGTEYVNDKVFVRNFLTDFSQALGVTPPLTLSEIDFTEVIKHVEMEKQRKLEMSREEKKKLAEERKRLREELREKYGYAIVDGVRVEVSNYVVEPPGIFMGRGKHPLRGRWKPPVSEEDITLNLSPDAPKPPGKWREIVWKPDNMWIAKWDDKLRGVEKYVWLADSSHLKQRKEIEKFNLAAKLEKEIGRLRSHIIANLRSPDPKRRRVATVCYLIDALKMRVGDEKDKDEADTVGATTLKPRHVKIEGNRVRFNFLGKDYVRWEKEVTMPDQVIANLKECIANAKSSLFPGVRSDIVSAFLSEVSPGLTAKVFRTYHATTVVKEYLNKAPVTVDQPEYYKRHVATMANLQAAVECNHKKKIPKNWRESLKKREERLKELKKRWKAKKSVKTLEAVRKLQLKIEEMKATRDYNLRTSLKSYIDPRAYYEWGRKVGYDWKLYYPKALQKKFSWVEGGNAEKTM